MREANLKLIQQLLGCEGQRDAFLHYVAESQVRLEQEEIEYKIKWLGERILHEDIEDLEPTGEFTAFLDMALRCAESGEVDGARHALSLMQGAFWERCFCVIVSRLRKDAYLHRFRKRDWLGPARFGRGEYKPFKSIRAPKIMMIVGDRWVLVDLKHETATKPEHRVPTGYYGMPAADYENMTRWSEVRPQIPVWFVVHDHGRLGKWSTENEAQDWFAAEVKALESPRNRKSRASETHFKDADMINSYWDKERFISLKDALERL